MSMNRQSRTGYPILAESTGFTLVELMVALALAIFLIGGVILMYSSGRAASLESEQLSRMQENIRFASDFMIRDIRNAGYRDRATLSATAASAISGQYAEILEDGEELRIRYAGRGSCSEPFAEDVFGVVVNEYFIEGGSLMCRGNVDGDPNDMGDAMALVNGVTDLSFEFICPDGGSSCECDAGGPFDRPVDDDGLSALGSACTGVRIQLGFRGLPDLSSGVEETRTMELTAAFRNVVLSRLNFLNNVSGGET